MTEPGGFAIVYNYSYYYKFDCRPDTTGMEMYLASNNTDTAHVNKLSE